MQLSSEVDVCVTAVSRTMPLKRYHLMTVDVTCLCIRPTFAIVFVETLFVVPPVEVHFKTKFKNDLFLKQQFYKHSTYFIVFETS